MNVRIIEEAGVSFRPQISYRDVPPSQSLDRLIQDEAAKLARFFDGIISCRVLVERAHRRHGTGSPFHVRIEVGVPGEQLVVSHTADTRPVPSADDEERARVSKALEHEPQHKDPALAVRDAFHKAERRMQDYAARL